MKIIIKSYTFTNEVIELSVSNLDEITVNQLAELYLIELVKHTIFEFTQADTVLSTRGVFPKNFTFLLKGKGYSADLEKSGQLIVSNILNAQDITSDEVTLFVLINIVDHDNKPIKVSTVKCTPIPFLSIEEAIHTGLVSSVNYALIHCGNINAYSLDGSPPLHHAVKLGNLEIVQVLLLAGADVNLDDTEHRKTPLCIAAAEGHLDIAELLIDSGARIDRHHMMSRSPLYFAAENGRIGIVEMLLDRDGLGEDSRSLDGTALSIASQMGHVDIMKLLIERGVDINRSDNTLRMTPLHHAAHHGQLEAVRLLLSAGANLYKLSYSSTSALRMAINKGHVSQVYQDIVRELMHADVEHKLDIKLNNWNNVVSNKDIVLLRMLLVFCGRSFPREFMNRASHEQVNRMLTTVSQLNAEKQISTLIVDDWRKTDCTSRFFDVPRDILASVLAPMIEDPSYDAETLISTRETDYAPSFFGGRNELFERVAVSLLEDSSCIIFGFK